MTDLTPEEHDFSLSEVVLEADEMWACAEICMDARYGKEWSRKHPEAVGQLVIAAATLLAAREPR